MKFLTDEQLAELLPAETSSFPSPVPTQIVSSDEYLPVPQTEKQREVEARLKEMSDRLARHQGLSRRRFFQTAAGMAASFVAMNQVFGHIFDASEAEAATPDMATERAQALSGQFIIDGHTHFLRDDTRLMGFVKMREAFGKLGWNKELTGEQTIDDLKFNNYVKEIYMDSDTKVALLSNSPSDVPEDWFIPQAQVFETRAKVNKQAGSRRMMAHFTITPGQPGWLDQVDQAIEVYKPNSWKGYTVGDNTHKELARYPWHADDEKLMYPFYEKIAKSGIRNVCIHKGCLRRRSKSNSRGCAPTPMSATSARRPRTGRSSISSSITRPIAGSAAARPTAWPSSTRPAAARGPATSPRSRQKYGVTNVYGDLGQIFAWTAVAEPRLAAALMGMLIKGLGPDHVVWGTDAVWTGAPQWQIEGLRRLEIPEDMQKKYGFKPLGPADGPVKTGIFSGNSARLYNFEQHAELARPDRFAEIKADTSRTAPAAATCATATSASQAEALLPGDRDQRFRAALAAGQSRPLPTRN